MISPTLLSFRHITGFQPFVRDLACCVHAGLIQRGQGLFVSMILMYQIKPKLGHCGCMVVDLHGCSGQVREALDLIQSMPMKPNAALWGALLSAYRNHGAWRLRSLLISNIGIRVIMCCCPIFMPKDVNGTKLRMFEC